MEAVLEILKGILFGVVEGVTEWLPISSTGHMIILEDIIKLDVSEDFWNFFLVVFQLWAIIAVVVTMWHKIDPFVYSKETGLKVKMSTVKLWLKIIVACIPAAIVGILFDDILEEYLYNSIVVSIMLIVFGIGFIIIESKKRERFRVNSLKDLSYKDAIYIGLFQLIAAIFPGTSRSGATILGALMIGVNRTVATEFTFFLAIPVMFGASLLKVIKIGLAFTFTEYLILFAGMLSAFIVSVLVIKFLLNYVKKHDFKPFGYYRIVLGVIVLVYFIFN